MTIPDYPLLTVPGYELYQLAHLATFIVDGLDRYRRGGNWDERRKAARNVQAGRVALARATGVPDAAGGPLPRPLDMNAYRSAQDLLCGDGRRQAQVVSLAGLGRSTWAVVGSVPGIGPVGGEVADHTTARALRDHLLNAPISEVRGWSVTARPVWLGVERWGSADEAAVVGALNPGREPHRVVVGQLRGLSREVDAAIARRFEGYSQNPPAAGDVPRPSQSPPARSGAATAAAFDAAAGALGADSAKSVEPPLRSDPGLPPGQGARVAPTVPAPAATHPLRR